MRLITDQERRWRLARRHRLVGSPTTVDDAAAALVGLHSTDPVTVFLAIAVRGAADSVTEVEAALYEHRTCLRMLGMRRTLFVVPVDGISVVQRAYTDSFVERERKRLAGWFETTGVAADGAAHIDAMIDVVFDMLEELGDASTRELTTGRPELDRRFVPPVGSQTGSLSVGSRIVLLMTASGALARTRPLGTWISSQYRYAPMSRWIGTDVAEMDAAIARAHLARAWLSGYGPGTVTDLQWWTGWNLGQTRAALGDVGAVEVALESGPGFVLADDLAPVDPVDPWAALLPALDSTPMGWKQRDWYLGDHVPHVFDRNGNVGPTVWWDGRVVGGWAQRADGELAIEYLEDIPADGRRLVEVEADRLSAFIGPSRFTPRFATPLERRLATS